MPPKFEIHVNEEQLGGIYRIVCEVNRREYIGKTSRFLARWYEHAHALACSNHKEAIQSDYVKYGSKQFKFEILEISNDPKHRTVLENKYITERKPYYNGLNKNLEYRKSKMKIDYPDEPDMGEEMTFVTNSDGSITYRQGRLTYTIKVSST